MLLSVFLFVSARSGHADVPVGFSSVQIVHQEFMDPNGCQTGPTFLAAPMMVIDAPEFEQFGDNGCFQVNPVPDPFNISLFFTKPPPFEYVRLARDLCGPAGTVGNLCVGTQVGKVGSLLMTVSGCVTQDANQCAFLHDEKFCGLDATVATLEAAFGGWTYKGRKQTQAERIAGTCSAPPSATASVALTAAPVTVHPGDVVTVTLTVTAGDARLDNIVPSALVASGDGGVTLVSGPVPTHLVTLAANAGADFRYTYHATTEGYLSFTGNADADGGVHASACSNLAFVQTSSSAGLNTAAAAGGAIAAGLASSPNQTHGPKPVGCGDGRFRLVDHAPLVTGGALVDVDVLALRRHVFSIASGCDPTIAALKEGKTGTQITAKWKRCGALTDVNFAGTIATPGCESLTGTFKAKGQPSASIHAERSRCGDGVVDAGNGEDCDGAIGCAAGQRCDVATCQCLEGPPVCGDGVVSTGEPCDPLASPSGCPSGMQCDLAGDACACSAVPDVIGKSVSFSFTAVDLATLGLPVLPSGDLEFSPGPNGDLVLDPARQDATTALGRCAAWISACHAPPERSLDDCARSAPVCTTAEPWLEADACCPAGCFPAYEARRLSGVSSVLALRQTYFADPACVPAGALGGTP